METISIIFETICRIVYAIVGGTIAVAFVGGIVGSFIYMAYHIIKYGWKSFETEFIR